MMYLQPCRGLGQHGRATQRHARVSSWMSYEVYNRFSKPVVRRADMSDGRYVVMSRQPHCRRRLPLGVCQSERQFSTINVDQRVLEFRPGDESRDAVFIDVVHRGICFETRCIRAVILFHFLCEMEELRNGLVTSKAGQEQDVFAKRRRNCQRPTCLCVV